MINRFTSNEGKRRNLDPYYRRFQLLMYGGREWMNIVLAIGTIDESIVLNMNAELQRRMAATHPLHQRRDEMSKLPRDQRPAKQRKGIDHQISNAKQLREAAKLLDKKIAKVDKDWERGRCTMGGAEYYNLCHERDAAWDEAYQIPTLHSCPCINAGHHPQPPFLSLHQRRTVYYGARGPGPGPGHQHSIQAEYVSDAAGYPYNDRFGNKRNDTPRDLAGLTLRAWCADKGIQYS